METVSSKLYDNIWLWHHIALWGDSHEDKVELTSIFQQKRYARCPFLHTDDYMSPQPQWQSDKILFYWPHVKEHDVLDDIERQCEFNAITLAPYDDNMKKWCDPPAGKEVVEGTKNETSLVQFQTCQPVVFSRELYSTCRLAVRQHELEMLYRHRQVNDDVIDFWMAW